MNVILEELDKFLKMAERMGHGFFYEYSAHIKKYSFHLFYGGWNKDGKDRSHTVIVDPKTPREEIVYLLGSLRKDTRWAGSGIMTFKKGDLLITVQEKEGEPDIVGVDYLGTELIDLHDELFMGENLLDWVCEQIEEERKGWLE